MTSNDEHGSKKERRNDNKEAADYRLRRPGLKFDWARGEKKN